MQSASHFRRKLQLPQPRLKDGLSCQMQLDPPVSAGRRQHRPDRKQEAPQLKHRRREHVAANYAVSGILVPHTNVTLSRIYLQVLRPCTHTAN